MAESKIYRLEEMLDSMKNAFDNAKKVREQQEHLLKLVKTHDKQNEFKEFVDESNAQLENLSKQISTLETRIEFISNVVDKCKVDEQNSQIVNDLLAGLGVFEE